VLFLMLMASDTFETGISRYNIAGFFVQTIPAVVIAATSILGFFRPRSGFYVFLIISAAFTIFFHTYRSGINFMVISFPPLLISLLLFVSSMKNRSKQGINHCAFYGSINSK
jgi:energy-coupling factor transporter transmembrane protein EcfT